MSLPIFLHSGMLGAPILTQANGSMNALLNAILVNGFNTQSVVTATASAGVVTFNFASAPGFSAGDTVTIAGASNATVNGQKRAQSAASNQVMVDIPGVPDGAVGGTITFKFSPLGWTRPYTSTNIGCYRQGGGESFFRTVRVRDSTLATTYGYNIRGYESMSAHSTGTNPFPTVAQVAGDGPSFYGPYPSGSTAPSDPRPWIVVGTPRAFYLCIGSFFDNGSVTANGMLPPADVLPGVACSVVFFGDLANKAKPTDTYHTFISGAISNALMGAGYSYLARDAGGTAGAKMAYGISAAGGGTTSLSFGATYPSVADGGITFVGPSIVADFVAPFTHRGFFPGMLTPFESPTAGASALKVGTMVPTVSGVTGRVLLLAAGAVSSNYDFGLAIDEDWGDV